MDAGKGIIHKLIPPAILRVEAFLYQTTPTPST